MSRVGPGEAATYLVVLGEPGQRLEVPAGLDDVLARHGGCRVTAEDNGGLCVAFPGAPDAAAAACELQRCFGAPERLRTALHDGGEEPGLALAALAHRGQILLSAGAARQVERGLPAGAGLKALGTHRLRDLRTAEPVFQLTLAGSHEEFPPLISPDTVPNNLPVQVTSFVGRRREMAELQRLLAGGDRLVTLTGPGGSGKTRMAVHLAAGLLDRFADGAYMADLSGLTDPAQVAGAVAAVLKVREEPGRTPAEGVAAMVASRRVLLVLDNCEHLITAAARLASTLLLECPQLQLVATSREPLGIAGERVWQVPPLAVPDPGAALTAGTLTGFEAVRLFLERARAVSPAFAVTDGNAAALATVCKRLDGVPLAIELAAARTRLLSVEQIADRLDDRLRLLSAGRGALPRHQTLRAAIDWSYDLLTEAERVLWRRLAVFADRFALEAAEAVCAGDPIDVLDVLELLAQLVDKSLVIAEEVRGEKRYRLLETIRQYGRERLREAGEETALLAAHRAWSVAFAREAAQGLAGTDQSYWSGRVDLEQENLRQAVHGSLEAGEVDPALEICGLLGSFLYRRGQFTAARELLERAIAVADAQPVSPVHKAQVITGLGMVNHGMGEFDEAERHYGRSLTISREAGDLLGEARSLLSWGVLKLYRVQYPEAKQLLEDAMTAARQFNFPQILPVALVNLATVYADQGDFDTARRHLDEANAHWFRQGHGTAFPSTLEVLAGISLAEGNLEAAEELYGKVLAVWRRGSDARGIGVALTGLANVALLRGELGRCRELVTESIRLRQSVGDSLGQAASLETFAWLAAAEGSPALALRLAGGADAVRRRMGTPVPPVRQLRSDRLLAPARQALTAAAAANGFSAGARMPLPELVELACAPAAGPAAMAVAAAAPHKPTHPAPVPAQPDPAVESLTPRELEILRLAARGLTAREIGQKLYLSPRTVEKHEENIRTKLDLPNRAALVVWAVRRGLIEEEA